MGAEGAVNILYRKSTPEEKQEIIKEYENKFSNPYRAAERGLIDEVIMPRDTRYKLAQALDMCHNKTKVILPKAWQYAVVMKVPSLYFRVLII